jgi:hypothetical protein
MQIELLISEIPRGLTVGYKGGIIYAHKEIAAVFVQLCSAPSDAEVFVSNVTQVGQ